jgi:hypothetical protein
MWLKAARPPSGSTFGDDIPKERGRVLRESRLSHGWGFGEILCHICALFLRNNKRNNCFSPLRTWRDASHPCEAFNPNRVVKVVEEKASRIPLGDDVPKECPFPHYYRTNFLVSQGEIEKKYLDIFKFIHVKNDLIMGQGKFDR